MRLLSVVLLIVGMFGINGCILTKAVTVPMRVAGAVISIVPVIGNPADTAVDKAADAVDKVPF